MRSQLRAVRREMFIEPRIQKKHLPMRSKVAFDLMGF